MSLRVWYTVFAEWQNCGMTKRHAQSSSITVESLIKGYPT